MDLCALYTIMQENFRQKGKSIDIILVQQGMKKEDRCIIYDRSVLYLKAKILSLRGICH